MVFPALQRYVYFMFIKVKNIYGTTVIYGRLFIVIISNNSIRQQQFTHISLTLLKILSAAALIRNIYID